MDNKIKYLIAACLLIALAIGGYAIYDAQQKKIARSAEVQRDLSTKQKLDLEQKVSEANKVLEVTAIDERKYDAFVDKAEALFKLGRLAQAKDAVSLAINIFPDRTQAYSALFDIQVDMQDYRAAEATIKTIMAKNSSSTYWNQYIDFKKDKLAATTEQLDALYNEALAKTENNINIITAYAKFLEQSGNTQKAIEYWKKAGETDPDDKATYDAEITRLGGTVEVK